MSAASDTPALSDSSTPGGSTESVSVLRGPEVRVNTKRVVQVLLGVGMASLLVLGILLVVSGAHRNAQITELHHHGVKVEISVTGCTGVASGSGSTPAGFTCHGDFTVGGHHYNEIIGGETNQLDVGTTVHAVAVPDDPALVTTVQSLATQHASFSVFIVPIVLLGAFALLTVIGFLRRRGSPG